MHNELKEILIDARNKKKLTHEQVASQTNSLLIYKSISRQYYGMIENGERRPSVEVAKSLAMVLGIDWTIFFEENCNQTLCTVNTIM